MAAEDIIILPCPHCGAKTKTRREAMKAHKWGVCVGCGGVVMAVSDTGLRKPTSEEMDRITADPLNIAAMALAWLTARNELRAQAIARAAKN